MLVNGDRLLYSGKREEVEARVGEQFEIAKSNVKKLIDQYSGIKFETQKTAQVRIFKDKKIPVAGNQSKNSNAATTAGTVAVAVLSTIIAAAAISAGGAAGAAGSSGESGNEEKSERSSYKMVLYKEFGDKIRYNGETVFVYAKMMEVRPDGTELDRLDLTQRIEISRMKVFVNISGCFIGKLWARHFSATASQHKGMLRKDY